MMRRISLLCFVFLLAHSGFAQQWVNSNSFSAPDVDDHDYFGHSIFQSGNYMFILSHGDEYGSDASLEGAGSVYMYIKNYAGIWEPKQKIEHPSLNLRRKSEFGQSLCMQGDYLFIGDKASSYDGNSWCGVVFMYTLNSYGLFDYVTYIKPENAQTNDSFASSLAMNGEFLFVGRPGNSFDAEENNEIEWAGSVEIYKLGGQGAWNYYGKVVSPERGVRNWFGSSLSLSGNDLIISEVSKKRSDNEEINEGRVHCYVYDPLLPSQGWQYKSSIVNPDDESACIFGAHVVCDGDILLITDNRYDFDYTGQISVTDAGLIYVYTKNSDSGIWELSDRLGVPEKYRYENVSLGDIVSIDGDFIVAGTVCDRTDLDGLDPLDYSGAAYIFSRKSGDWAFLQKIISPNRIENGWFASSSSISGKTLMIGDCYSSEFAEKAGAVVCYEYQAGTGKFELEANHAMNIYPNPAEENLMVDLGAYSGESELILFTIGGAQVLKCHLVSNQCKLDVSRFKTGVYVLSVSTSERVFKERVLIQ